MRAALVLALAAALAGCASNPDPAPAVAATTTTVVPVPENPGRPAPIVDMTLADGGKVRVYTDVVERIGGIHIVRYELENIGAQPVDTTRFRAEVEDTEGHRFEQQPPTDGDFPGTLQHEEEGVVNARFKLPGTEPTVLYIHDPGGGDPIPVVIP